MTAVHIGTTPWRQDRSAQALIEQAKFAEELGYDSFWLPENHFNEAAIPDPLMLLASVAGATARIKLATTSYLLPLRHPLQAAEQVAVLDQLSGGRVILGVGRGVGADMLRAFAVEPKDKRARFEATLKHMIKAWSGVPVSGNSGTALSSSGVTVHPSPIQVPHPPIWVAAFGPKALTQAGRMGLPYLASPLEALEDLIENYALHSAACEKARVAAPAVKPVMRIVFVSNHRQTVNKVRELLQQHYADSNWRSEAARLDDWAIVGDAVLVKEKIAQYREQLGLTHLIVTRLRVDTHHPALDDAQLRESLKLIALITRR